MATPAPTPAIHPLPALSNSNSFLHHPPRLLLNPSNTRIPIHMDNPRIHMHPILSTIYPSTHMIMPPPLVRHPTFLIQPTLI
jgi:hypothetical protein